MKPIIKQACKINDTYYDVGEEIEVDTIQQLQKLNEIGFIEPLTPKQMQDYFKNKIIKKEE